MAPYIPDKKLKTKEEIAEAVKHRMTDILALIEAMAAQEEDCDIKLAELLENESEQVRVAIVEKLRELIREKTVEKDRQVNQNLEASKRHQAEQQRSIFMNWLSWIMSEETLRKIRLMFSVQPMLERTVKSIGQELFERGVLTNIQLTDKRELGELANNAPNLQTGRQRGEDKGRV